MAQGECPVQEAVPAWQQGLALYFLPEAPLQQRKEKKRKERIPKANAKADNKDEFIWNPRNRCK